MLKFVLNGANMQSIMFAFFLSDRPTREGRNC